MKELFLLDPDVIFLNHGSFGATPRPVWDAYHDWQIRLEQQPVQFIAREMIPELKHTRQILASNLNTNDDDIVFVPNATFGVNLVARSLQLEPGDEILITDHEYGACENVWQFLGEKVGASLVRQPITFPLSSPEEIVEQFWKGVTPRTRVIFISHITSPTAAHMPVAQICRKAQQANIISIIDGAHAPGQIPLDLEEIAPDFYIGNCHKWMLSPKGAGFLYSKRELQSLVEPLVVSWGWGENEAYSTESSYIHSLEWWGTKDPSAYLSVPAAIRFQSDYNWPEVQARCKQILSNGIQSILDLTGLPSFYSDATEPFVQMAVARLPLVRDLAQFQAQLYQQYRIEVPCIHWNQLHLIRVSVQGYNSPDELDNLVYALAELLPGHRV